MYKILSNTIFRRLIFSFLIITAPLYIIGISIYNWGIGLVQDEIVNSMTSQGKYYMNKLEGDIKRIKELQIDCTNDESLLKLANIGHYLSDLERTMAIQQLMNRMYSIKNSSIYIEDITAYIPSIDRSYSVINGVNVLTKDVYKDLSSYFWDKTFSLISVKKETMYLGSTYPLDKRDIRGLPILLLLVKLSSQDIENTLSQFEDGIKTDAFIYHYPSQKVLSIGNKDGSGQKLISSIINSEEARDKSIIGEGRLSIAISGIKYFGVNVFSEDLEMKLTTFSTEKEIFSGVKKYTIWLWLFAAISIIVIIIFSASTYKFVYSPLSKLVGAFKKVETGNLEVNIFHKSKDEFRYIYERFNRMVGNLSELIDQVFKNKILFQQAELKQLQARINPHFLYNSFFILETMAKTKDFEGIEEFTRYLGEYFSFITYTDSVEITLEEEIKNAWVYSQIQMIRFSNRICVNFDTTPDIFKRMKVPRLIIQPIIENCFEHAFKNMIRDGRIDVTYETSSEMVKIFIKDNGKIDDVAFEELNERLNNAEKMENMEGVAGMDGIDGINDIDGIKNMEAIEGIEVSGISNVNNRIKLRFSFDSGLRLSKNESGGLTVEISIPLKDKDVLIA